MGLLDFIRDAKLYKMIKEDAEENAGYISENEYRQPKFLNWGPRNFYFGEVDSNKKPKGCGLFHTEQYFAMYENVSNLKGTGMTIFYPLDDDSDDPFLCMFDNYARPFGPILYIADQKSISLSFIRSGSHDGFYFNVTPDGEYIIGRHFDGGELNFTLKFNNTNNILTYSDSSTGQRIKIPVSENFKYNFHKRMYVEPFPYGMHEVSPARIEQAHYRNNHEYAYYGGITSYSDGVKMSDKHASTNSGYGYGMVPLRNGDFYFGAFFEGKFSGTGCYRRKEDNVAFLGQFSNNQKHGNIVAVYGPYSYELSSFYHEKKNGVSFNIKDNILYIQPYKNNKQVDYYFKFAPEMDKLEKYSLNNQLLETFVLPKVKLSNKELNKLLEEAKKELEEKQKVSHKKRVVSKSEAMTLTDYEYEITDDDKIKITKFKKKQEKIVKIPSCVEIIGSYCFKESTIYNIEMPNSIVKVEENGLCDIDGLWGISFSSNLKNIGANFANSKYITHIEFPKTVNVISKNAFTRCEKLEFVELHKTTKYSKESFPSHCRIDIIDENEEKANNKTKKTKTKKEGFFKKIIGKIKDAIYERQLQSDLGVVSNKKAKTKKYHDFNIEFNVFSIIQLVVLAVVVFYMVSALTGFIVNMSDGLYKMVEWSTSLKITYKFFLVNQAVKLFALEMGIGLKIFLSIIFAILVAISAVADILIYIILGVLLAVAVVGTYILDLTLLLAVPLILLIGEIIYYFKEVKDEEDSHLISTILIILTTICDIIFIISVVHRAIYKY